LAKQLSLIQCSESGGTRQIQLLAESHPATELLEVHYN
jgi:hypothetical protein